MAQGRTFRSNFRDPSGNSIEFANPEDLGTVMRKLDGKRLVVASHNKGKLVEIAELIAPYGLEAKSAGEYGLPEPEETGTTLRGERLSQGVLPRRRPPACRRSPTIPASPSTRSMARLASIPPTG